MLKSLQIQRYSLSYYLVVDADPATYNGTHKLLLKISSCFRQLLPHEFLPLVGIAHRQPFSFHLEFGFSTLGGLSQLLLKYGSLLCASSREGEEIDTTTPGRLHLATGKRPNADHVLFNPIIKKSNLKNSTGRCRYKSNQPATHATATISHYSTRSHA